MAIVASLRVRGNWPAL